MKEYYLIRFLMENKETYCIWCSDIKDSLLTHGEKLLSFSNLQSVKKYCAKNKIELSSSDVSTYNIIELKNLMVKNDVSNYNLYLDFWNIINDAMRSVEQDFIGDDKLYVGIYDKLFFGLNLLIRPEDEKYIPVWSQEEILKLKEIMNMGIDFFDCQFQERIL